ILPSIAETNPNQSTANLLTKPPTPFQTSKSQPIPPITPPTHLMPGPTLNPITKIPPITTILSPLLPPSNLHFSTSSSINLNSFISLTTIFLLFNLR
ncbi:hypothetical protein, partial [Bacillus sp. WP8]|uniref:hypothetical protein n=1 Tax=Bacillus sp. WP8 TaxID=756828 RepID=UPI001C9310F7